jgi:hypothetical protein
VNVFGKHLGRGTAIVVVAALAAACGGGDSSGTATNLPAPTVAASPTGAAPQASPAAALTDVELDWILAGQNLVERLGVAQARQAGGELTKAQARAQAKTLRGCATGLRQMGPAPTGRLKPAYDLFTAACRRYDQAASCYLTIGDAPDVVSQREARKITEAADCVTAAATEGATKLATAVEHLNQIKLTAGYESPGSPRR